MAENAIRAIIASLIIISIYITLRFQWKFAVPVLIALSHDLLITSGVYALTGREVTASTVAALLTILGFSLYDTIVVFDRVRENIPRMPNAAFSQIYNRSMSEVIVRSLATSFCAALPILALMLFGGETLQDFAFALLIGTHLRHLLVGVHRRPRAHALEGARARLPGARGAHPGRVRQGARLRGGHGRRPCRRRPGRAQAPARPADLARRPLARRVADEFDEMVQDLGVEEAQARSRPPPAAAPAAARARRAGDKPKKPRNRRAREAALMAALVWVMMGIALWHFAIFVPDHFWSGIVGAFVGAVLGALLFGFLVHGLTVPGPRRHRPDQRARGDPRARSPAWPSSTSSASGRNRPRRRGAGDALSGRARSTTDDFAAAF